MATPLSATPQFWGWLAIALVLGGLLYLLSPILAPFLFAAILAYILDPLVERMTGRRVPRTLAVLLVMLGVLALLVALALVVLPLFAKELRLLAERMPAFVAWLNERLVPLAERYPFPGRVDARRYARLTDEVRAQLARELPAAIRDSRGVRLVGTAGTVTTLAALDLGLEHYEAARVQEELRMALQITNDALAVVQTKLSQPAENGSR